MCRISTESQDFVIDDRYCDCWGDAEYEPPQELYHLMSKHECEQLPDAESDDEECAVPTQRRRAKSFQQRLAEKTMRAKRLTMAKEAHHWYMKGDASKLKEPDKSSASCSTAITPKKRNKMSSSAKSSYTPQKSTFPSRTKTTMTQTLRRTFPYNCDTDRVQTHLRLAGFTTPNRKENDTVSLRSGGSEVKRRVILDVIQWDSE